MKMADVVSKCRSMFAAKLNEIKVLKKEYAEIAKGDPFIGSYFDTDDFLDEAGEDFCNFSHLLKK